jgi:predicted DNA-binding transcriptional regulator YafY
MEILKHGSSVEVLAPASLKKRVVEELKKAQSQY